MDPEPDRRLLDEQIVYYRRRAPEFDASMLATHATEPFATMWKELLAALDRFRPRGNVLELACGTGQWTALLARRADRVTAVDASPEMLERCRARVPAAKLECVVADIFSYEPDAAYDVVFFGFWLSHVPLGRFDAFWDLVRRCLAPDGRVFFIDEGRHGLWREERADAGDPTIVRRPLADGSVHRIVKVLWDTAELERRIRAIGWDIAVHRAGAYYWGAGRRPSPR
jgi:SAM-dependent methyltransferase